MGEIRVLVDENEQNMIKMVEMTLNWPNFVNPGQFGSI